MKLNLKKIKVLFVKNIKWLVLFLTLIIFFFLLESVFNEEILKFDDLGYHLVSTYLMCDFVTIAFKFITNLGGGIWLIFLAFSLLLLIKRKEIGFLIFSNLGIVAIINIFLKNIIARERPVEFRIVSESGYSFPSGHSMVSMAFYGFLIYLVYKKIDNKILKWSIIICLSLLILLIGISRIYLGVHYTSDVIAGFTLAISYLIIYISVVNKYILESR